MQPPPPPVSTETGSGASELSQEPQAVTSEKEGDVLDIPLGTTGVAQSTSAHGDEQAPMPQPMYSPAGLAAL